MTQYDHIATNYLASKLNSSFREDVEYHSFVHRLVLRALNIKDATIINLHQVLAEYRILDLGCGAGYLTRKLREELGCKDIVGIDISSAMIGIGRACEEAHPLGIIYHVSDVQHLVKPEKKFDFVVAFYLLNYAKTREELDRMVQVIGEHLTGSDKGYFLSITGNVCAGENALDPDRYCKYGYRCEVETPLVDGAQIKNIHFNPDSTSFSYITYYFSPRIYEEAFQKAGFKYFEWVPVETASELQKYEDLLKCPPVIGILAHK
ncbi:unnamed protein product [Rotaria socialis]|uniref:Methyltransferase domain-containing protein n=2 Tax=Rotaria socialis TaxID=392032 RepID=A0A821YPS5_9BILA|nr:unnamed protein product [Rotaria socialis]CAF3356522.1 unnamed protein product [Rotaria socialis]CAF4962862.1 unnamed protein product [Rotaria socialis]